MSSEALREAKVWLEQLASADRELVRTSGLAAALLAEVARLEQGRDEWISRYDKVSAELYDSVAALAVARKREQRWQQAAQEALAFTDTLAFAVNALDSERWNPLPGRFQDVVVRLRQDADKALRAALVDEPAAGGEGGGRPDGVAVADSQHREHGPRPDRLSAAATMAEPEQAERREHQRLDAPVKGTPPGSASAAADEPGETPA